MLPISCCCWNNSRETLIYFTDFLECCGTYIGTVGPDAPVSRQSFESGGLSAEKQEGTAGCLVTTAIEEWTRRRLVCQWTVSNQIQKRKGLIPPSTHRIDSSFIFKRQTAVYIPMLWLDPDAAGLFKLHQVINMCGYWFISDLIYHTARWALCVYRKIFRIVYIVSGSVVVASLHITRAMEKGGVIDECLFFCCM